MLPKAKFMKPCQTTRDRIAIWAILLAFVFTTGISGGNRASCCCTVLSIPKLVGLETSVATNQVACPNCALQTRSQKSSNSLSKPPVSSCCASDRLTNSENLPSHCRCELRSLPYAVLPVDSPEKASSQPSDLYFLAVHPIDGTTDLPSLRSTGQLDASPPSAAVRCAELCSWQN